MVRSFFPILFISVLISAQAQKSDFKILLQNVPQSSPPKLDISIDKDSLAVIQSVDNEIQQLRQNGYLLANRDSIRSFNNQVEVYISIGERYHWINLSLSALPSSLVAKLDLKETYFRNKAVRVSDLDQLTTDILDYSQRNGFPFAKVQLDSLQVLQDFLSAAIKYESGPIITFDSIRIIGKKKIQHRFLSNYLEIKAGKPYDELLVAEVSQRISQLGYLQLVEPPTLSFQNEQAILHLPLDHIKSSTIDGVIGFLPKEGNGGKLLVTGQLDLNLNNLFGAGKAITMNWQRVRPESQSLNLRYYHPFMLGSRLSLESSFGLLKEDSSFVNIKGRFGFEYRPAFNQTLSLFAEAFSGRSASAQNSADATKLPLVSDINNITYGIDYTLNSRKRDLVTARGFRLNITAGVGSKTIKIDPNVEPSVYQNVDLSSIQLQTQLLVEKSTPISNRSLLVTRLSGQAVINNQLFLNDLFRLGGINSLRGFAENEFFAAEYALATIEWRLLSGERSYLFIFYDQALLRYKLPQTQFEDSPFGLGVGMALSTTSGVLNLAYALGNSKGQPLSLDFSKFHFGYVGKF